MNRPQARRKAGGCALILAAVSLLAGSDLRADAAQAPAPPANVESAELDEVVVSVKKLYQILKDIDVAEDRFYALYNKLNTNPAFEVQCQRTAPTGSLIERRMCEPAYQVNAEIAEGQAFVRGQFAIPAETVAGYYKVAYRKHMLELLRAHPELFQLLRERVNMERQYRLTRRERFKDHWILFD